MDCLDRTNVVQAAIAKRSLTLQLRELGVLVEKDHVDNHEEFMAMFRNGMSFLILFSTKLC